jgi:hypothetical protein
MRPGPKKGCRAIGKKKRLCIYLRFVVPQAVTIIWDVMPWNLVKVYRHFRGKCYLHFQGGSVSQVSNNQVVKHNSLFNREDLGSMVIRNVSKFCKNTRRHVQENSTFPVFVYLSFT